MPIRVLGLLLLWAVLPPSLWPGLIAGTLLFWGLWRSRYANGFLWFSVFPGLYVFWGVEINIESLLRAFEQWGTLSMALVLWGSLASAALRSDRWAVAWMLPLVLWQPTGWVVGLLALLQGVYSLERERAMAQEVGRGFDRPPRNLIAALTVVALVGLSVLALPIPQGLDLGGGKTNPPLTEATPTNQPLSATANRSTATPTPQEVRTYRESTFSRFAENTAAWLQTGGAFLVALALVLVVAATLRQRATKQRGGWALMPLLVVTLTWGMLLAWFVLSGSGQGEGSGAGIAGPSGGANAMGQASTPPTAIQRETSADGAALFSLSLAGVLFAGTVLLLWLAWRLWRLPPEHPMAIAVRKSHIPADPLATPPDRIRRAYQAFLQSMRGLGLGRSPFESPREYALRLARTSPTASSGLLELTQLYEPVRYGAIANPHHAERAENLAKELPLAFKKENL